MATYKVIQDIEAEDKFVGPLTLKQFVFGMAGGLFSYISFILVVKGAGFGLIVSAPIAFFGFFMAFPWSSQQPTDVWILAKVRFRFKSKKRIWDQAGMQELVTITVPKKEEKILTNNLTQKEVKSRLKALAETIDSRGWVVKNTSLQEAVSDRLVSADVLPRQVSELDGNIPDMLDNHSLDGMMQKQDELRKARLVEKMNRIRQGEPLESINQPEIKVVPPSEQYSSTTDKTDEQTLSKSLKAKRTAGDVAYNNMHTVVAKPVSPVVKTSPPNPANDSSKKTGVKKAISAVTEQGRPDIIGLARNNDLNVATIARQLNNDEVEKSSSEVVVSLH